MSWENKKPALGDAFRHPMVYMVVGYVFTGAIRILPLNAGGTMIRNNFGNSAVAVTAALLALGGSPDVLAGEDWRSNDGNGPPGDWKHNALAQVNSYETPTSALDFGLQSNLDADPGLPTLLADASGDAEKGGEAASAKCAEFEKDINADVGDIIRAGCTPTTAQMAKLMDNPLGNVAMWVNQIDVYRLENPNNGKEANKANYMGILQFPKGISENWNLINRIVYNVPSMPIDQDKIDTLGDNYGSAPGTILPPSGSPPAPLDLLSGRTTGFGDLYYVGLFSPKEGIKMEGGGTTVWGVGFDLGMPTATEDILGTGKWIGGPSALTAYLGPKWKVGLLAQQYWDFAGDSDRDPVNLTNIQYLWYYSLNPTTSIGAMPNIIANWEQDSGNVWTVPVGVGINKTINIGKVPVRFGAEVYYSVVQPDDVIGSKWDLRLYATPAVPSALFKWMQ